MTAGDKIHSHFIELPTEDYHFRHSLAIMPLQNFDPSFAQSSTNRWARVPDIKPYRFRLGEALCFLVSKTSRIFYW